jgi:large subunit ribosomal protein L10
MVAPKPSGIANTKEGKTAILERTKKLLDGTNLLITIPNKGITKEAIDLLRKELPKSSKASVVKNSLMRKAVEGTAFAPVVSSLKNENLFFFVTEGDAKKSFDAFKKWQKEVKRAEPEFDAKSAVMEGVVYVGKSIDSVVSLPTKAELITKIALGIKAVPLKVARGVKAVPNKLGRAFGALKSKLEEDASASASV